MKKSKFKIGDHVIVNRFLGNYKGIITMDNLNSCWISIEGFKSPKFTFEYNIERDVNYYREERLKVLLK